ncbi:MAG TPA: transposase [Bryobacteraceae bacterium]|nr:transposase [Bryobacteraceae bacterium]
MESKRATEPFRQSVFQKRWHGINTAAAWGNGRGWTALRWDAGPWTYSSVWPGRGTEYFVTVPGIDEHFFTRRHGYETTFCDLKGHKIFDVVLGRSEASLESYLEKLPGKEQVHVVWMDLASVHRAIAGNYFPMRELWRIAFM